MQEEQAKKYAQELADSPLFKGVDVADRVALVLSMRQQSYQKDAVLFEKDSMGDSMYLIVSGQVRIYSYDSEGREFTIRHLSEMFGEFAMLDHRPRSAGAAAAGPLEVLVLHRDDFLAFLKERPLVGLAMMRNLVERVRYTTTYLQKVLDATQQLKDGEYEQALEHIPASATDVEIQGLIDAFLQMVSDIQAREAVLKQRASG